MSASVGRLGVLLLAIVSCGGALAESPWSTEEFLGRRKDWEKFRDTPIKVEGRVLAFNRQQLRLQRCDVIFHLGENHSGRVTSSRRVEMQGRLRKVDDKIGFYVEDLQGLPSDLEELQSRDARLKQAKAADYYELADWAAHRAEFYDDRPLQLQAQAVYRRAVEAEGHELPAGDAEGRYRLAARARSYGLEELGDRLTFEGGLLESRAALGRTPLDPQELSTVAADLAKRLPGAGKPVADVPAELAERFAKDPLEAWRRSTPAERPVLQRLLWVGIQKARIILDAEDDGRNGRDISEQLRRIVPEEAALAQQYEDKSLAYRVERVAGLTRSELVALSQELTRRTKPAEARQAIAAWLQAREPRWREEGARGLVTLADERLALLKDVPGAVQVLIEAADLAPEDPAAANRLQSLGYARLAGRWQRATAVPDPSVVPGAGGTTAATSLQVGLSEGELRILLGEPSTRSRIATGRGITETWAYGARGTSRLVIVLERKSEERAATVRGFSAQDSQRGGR